MKARVFRTIAMALAVTGVWLATTAAAPDQAAPAQNWAQWRGPDATGVGRTATPPVAWSESKNIRWKIPIAGRGSASPIVWGNRVYVLTAIAENGGGTRAGVVHKYVVLAIDP